MEIECSRCGKCCFEPFCRQVRPDDLEAWKRAGRTDLVDIFEYEMVSTDRTNPEMARLGMAFHTCRFLKPEAPGRFYCVIYDHRPLTCSEFEVGYSRLCPNYRGRKPIKRPGS
jgi:Fe-S-cluster containining protein